jgi:uncharacterized protein YbbC (DUF1343 family)
MKKFNYAIIIISLVLGCSTADVYYNLPIRELRRVYTGLENFIENYADNYRGKRAAIVTNHSGVDFELRRNIELFREKGIEIAVVFAPEHGIYGYQNNYDKKLYIVDNDLNIIIYNLHHLDVLETRHLMKVSDIVIFDIQDMGMRCYTYISSLKMIMDALHSTDKELIVLDRPNPLGFLGTDGPFLEDGFYSRHISAFPSTFMYNMTIGEAALYYKDGYAKGLKLLVVPMVNYERDLYYTETMMPWVPPSPNLPTYESSIVYAAMVLLEGISISVGRGTAKPFEYIGANWIEPVAFCEGLKRLDIQAFRFRPVYFKPTFSKYEGKKCGGVQIFYAGGRFSPTEAAYKIIKYLRMNYSGEFGWERFGGNYDIDYLAGTDKFRRAIELGKSWEEFKKEIEKGIEMFIQRRQNYLIYGEDVPRGPTTPVQ